MALSPEALKQLQPNEKELVDRMEKEIDAELLEKYNPKLGAIRVTLTTSLTPRVADELVRRYQSAGWMSVMIEQGETVGSAANTLSLCERESRPTYSSYMDR